MRFSAQLRYSLQLRTLLSLGRARRWQDYSRHHLAVAAATVGSTVLLLEPDLRHPSLLEQFDISSGRVSTC